MVNEIWPVYVILDNENFYQIFLQKLPSGVSS